MLGSPIKPFAALRNEISAAGIKTVINIYNIAFLMIVPLNSIKIKIISNITSKAEVKTELSMSKLRLFAILAATQSKQ